MKNRWKGKQEERQVQFNSHKQTNKENRTGKRKIGTGMGKDEKGKGKQV